MRGIIKISGMFLISFLFCCFPILAQELDQDEIIDVEKNSLKRLAKMFQFLDQASEPTKFFSAPTGGILKSMEVMFTTGGSFGIENNRNFSKKIGFGLGNIAEVEFTSSNIANKLTGESTNLPTSVFKVSLVPERFAHLWYIPQMAVQLRSTTWQSVAKRESGLRSENTESYLGKSLSSLAMTSRFTTLYFVAGKNCSLGGLHVGFSLTDVRTRRGRQWIYDEISYDYIDLFIPEMKKEIAAPFGGIYIVANPQTQLMVEIEPIPLFEYDIKNRRVYVRKAWMGIGGIRFFISKWLSLDTGVKYQSD